MAEFDRLESQPDCPERSLVLTAVWVGDIPVGVSGGMGLEFMSVGSGIRGGSGAGKRRRKKLRFPSRITF